MKDSFFSLVCTLFLSSYLIGPLPLERYGDFEQNGYDPCKIDVTHDLKEHTQDLKNYNLAMKRLFLQQQQQ